MTARRQTHLNYNTTAVVAVHSSHGVVSVRRGVQDEFPKIHGTADLYDPDIVLWTVCFRQRMLNAESDVIACHLWENAEHHLLGWAGIDKEKNNKESMQTSTL